MSFEKVLEYNKAIKQKSDHKEHDKQRPLHPQPRLYLQVLQEAQRHEHEVDPQEEAEDVVCLLKANQKVASVDEIVPDEERQSPYDVDQPDREEQDDY